MAIRRRRSFCFAFAAALAALLTMPALAQSGRPVRVIVPFPPGGSADLLARVISQGLGDLAQEPVVVENHPGAGASIAYDLTARAAPDGNLVVVGSNSLLINPLLRKVSYDSLTSFAPVCNLVASPMIFAVNAASPLKTIGDLIAAAHARPGTLTLGALGPATTQHIAFESFKRATNSDIIFVPFSGGAPAVNALLGQHVDAALVNYSEGVEQIRAGKLRALATTSARRLKPAPDVPTVAESGYPGYASEVWLGLLGPAGTPPARVTQLSKWLTGLMSRPEIASKLEKVGSIRPSAAARHSPASCAPRRTSTRASSARPTSRSTNRGGSAALTGAWRSRDRALPD